MRQFLGPGPRPGVATRGPRVGGMGQLRPASAAAAVAVPVGCLFATGPAGATEWMYCGDTRSQVSIGLLLGLADGPSVVAATLESPTAAYTTNPVYGQGRIVSIRHARTMKGSSGIGLDFVADLGGGLVGELRLRLGKRGDAEVYRGKFGLTGKGSWTVSCDVE